MRVVPTCRGSLADVTEVASKLPVSFIHVLTSANAEADSLANEGMGRLGLVVNLGSL